jgi:hypothetical protein
LKLSPQERVTHLRHDGGSSKARGKYEELRSYAHKRSHSRRLVH